jgi:hypothetical protein
MLRKGRAVTGLMSFFVAEVLMSRGFGLINISTIWRISQRGWVFQQSTGTLRYVHPSPSYHNGGSANSSSWNALSPMYDKSDADAIPQIGLDSRDVASTTQLTDLVIQTQLLVNVTGKFIQQRYINCWKYFWIMIQNNKTFVWLTVIYCSLF